MKTYADPLKCYLERPAPMHTHCIALQKIEKRKVQFLLVQSHTNIFTSLGNTVPFAKEANLSYLNGHRRPLCKSNHVHG